MPGAAHDARVPGRTRGVHVIVTLTPNPSLDLLFSAGQLAWGDANRIPMPRRRAGGQGINVVRAARALRPGAEAHAIAPLGGPVGDELRSLLEAEGAPLTVVPIAGETRVFVGVRESETGRSLLLNPRGPEIAQEEAEGLLAAVHRILSGPPAQAPGSPDPGVGGVDPQPGRAAGGAWMVGCGSLPPGLAVDFYARVGRAAHSRGARFVPDCDGEALAAAVEAADLLVPNEQEAGRLVGRTVDGPGAAARAGNALLRRGPERVVITLGEHGAVAVDGTGAWWARPVPPMEGERRIAGASAVGAGDALLAALLQSLDDGLTIDAALVRAVAAGTAVLLSRGSDLVRLEDVEEVQTWIRVEALQITA